MSRKTNLTSERVKVVALVLEDHQGRFLVALRKKNQDQGGLWEFPGGKVEEGESRFNALKREVKEEIDFTLTSTNLLTTVLHNYSNKTVDIAFFYKKIKNPHVCANENQVLKWVSKKELIKLPMPNANSSVVSRLINHAH